MIHRITQTVLSSESGSGSGTTVTGQRYETATTATSIDQVYGVVTDTALAVAWSLTGLQSIILLADKDTTVKVNSSGTPDATISLKAGSPFVWNRSDAYYAYPFGASSTVTNLYVSTTVATRLSGLILTN